MFTGLIETVGKVVAAEPRGAALRLAVDLGRAAEGVRLGDSICLSGACQTVAALDGRVAAFDAVAETLAKTTLGAWKVGTRVNIERSLRPSDRLGGHFVAGHVDATGRVRENAQRPDGWWLVVEAPQELFAEIAPKGSIAIEGASLTVVECGTAALGGAHRQGFSTAEGGGATGQLSVTLIPTTLRETTLGDLAAGDRVNLETDLLAKYVRRTLGTAGATASDQRLSEALRRAGFIE